MPTESDHDLDLELRRALDELADDAELRSVGAVLSGPPSCSTVRSSRRRLVLVLAAAVALVAAVAVPWAVRTRDVEPARQPAPTGERVAGNWSMITTVKPPAGWVVTQREVYQNAEQTVLRPAGTSESKLNCYVTVNSPGADGNPGAGPSSTMAGRTGVYRSATDENGPAFYWTYDVDAWAQVNCNGMKNPKAMIEAVLAGVERGFAEVHVPFRLATVPADYRIEVIWDGSAVFGDERGIDLGGIKDGPSYPSGDILSIKWMDYDPQSMLTQFGGSPQRLEVDGRAWLYDASAAYSGQSTACVAQRPTICVINQQGGGTAEEIRDRMLKLVSDVEPAANLSDPSSWPSARDALPPQ